jgi:hypothetical protein
MIYICSNEKGADKEQDGEDPLRKPLTVFRDNLTQPQGASAKIWTGILF